jgi:hypothetical protein
MMIPPVPVCCRITPAGLTASQFQTLTEVLPDIEPFANLSRDHLVRQEPANDTIRRKLVAQPSFYAYLCERHAVLYNPVQEVKRALGKPGSHHARAW